MGPWAPETQWSFPAVPTHCGSCAGWVWSTVGLKQVRQKGKGSRKDDARGRGRALGRQAVREGGRSEAQAPVTDPGHGLAAPVGSGHQGLQGVGTTCPQPWGLGE